MLCVDTQALCLALNFYFNTDFKRIKCFYMLIMEITGKLIGVKKSVNNSKLALLYQQNITALQWCITNP